MKKDALDKIDALPETLTIEIPVQIVRTFVQGRARKRASRRAADAVRLSFRADGVAMDLAFGESFCASSSKVPLVDAIRTILADWVLAELGCCRSVVDERVMKKEQAP